MEGPAELAGEATARAAASPGGLSACAVCAIAPLCHPRGGDCRIPSPVERRIRLRGGQALVRAGCRQEGVYAVRAGFMKVRIPRAGGEGHIVRFLQPGDAAGLDAFGHGVHANDTIAVGDCEVCAIPVSRVESALRRHAGVAAHLRSLLAEELADSHAHAVALAQLTARQRVAGFLLDLSRRWRDRGYAELSFRLPMTRFEIGDYLGLTIETVSRTISDLRTRGWIAVHGRSVELREPAMLKANA